MEKNLILVANPRAMDWRDFHEISQIVMRENPRIHPIVVSTEQESTVVPDPLWQRPSLTVSFGDTGKFKPRRGVVLRNRTIHKYQQYVQFRLAGVDTPRTANFNASHEYTATDWGEFCILKPSDLGKMGKGGSVRLQRTVRLPAFDPARYPEEHVFRNSRLLVQSFIDTGAHPVNWRVLTLLGEPLYCFRSTCPVARPPLDSPDDVIESAVIEPKHPDAKQIFAYQDMRRFEADAAVMAFAREVYRAFPRIPLQGCDIVREEATGKLYILEINPGGNTWHFSSPIFARQRELLGGKEVFTRQLDAFGAAARILARRTEELAA
jgi:hypothetical protein